MHQQRVNRVKRQFIRSLLCIHKARPHNQAGGPFPTTLEHSFSPVTPRPVKRPPPALQRLRRRRRRQRRARRRKVVRVLVHVDHQTARRHRQVAVGRVQRDDLRDHLLARGRRAHELVLSRRRLREDGHERDVGGGLLGGSAGRGGDGSDEGGGGGSEEGGEVHLGERKWGFSGGGLWLARQISSCGVRRLCCDAPAGGGRWALLPGEQPPAAARLQGPVTSSRHPRNDWSCGQAVAADACRAYPPPSSGSAILRKFVRNIDCSSILSKWLADTEREGTQGGVSRSKLGAPSSLRTHLERRALGREAVGVRVHVQHETAGRDGQVAVRRVQRDDLLDHGVAGRGRAHELVLRVGGQCRGRQHGVARVLGALREGRLGQDTHERLVRGGLLGGRAGRGVGGADEGGGDGSEQSGEVHLGWRWRVDVVRVTEQIAE
ncbi:hypothetical protein ON010_g13570 [Phytophthora cinnamomi]|nr:hypothetical protein ON010_g13570 [Phytophthora cinnamomi]